MKRILNTVLVFLTLFAMPNSFPAKAASVPQELVDKARLTAENMLSDPGFPTLRRWMARAKGVLIIPSLLKAGFIIGAEGGSGVLLSRDDKGIWSYPAFYTLGGGSFGLQIGAQDSAVIFVIMTDKGLESVIKRQMKLGADASIAIGPMGGGVEGSTTTAMGPDIYSFSKSRGLYGGASFEGAMIAKRNNWNTGYYGKGATPEAIVIKRKFSNPGADALRKALVVR